MIYESMDIDISELSKTCLVQILAFTIFATFYRFVIPSDMESISIFQTLASFYYLIFQLSNHKSETCELLIIIAYKNDRRVENQNLFVRIY